MDTSPADARRLAAAEAQLRAGPTARQLEQLAQELAKTKEATADQDLDKIAEHLRQSAQRLRAEDASAEEATKAGLRELAELEQMLRQMQEQAPPNTSPEELQQLAKALAQNEATKKVAEALQAGQLAEAAQRLEAAAKDAPSQEAAEQTLREALERLAQQRQLSDAMQKLAQQAQQRSGSGEAGKALQQLAQMLRQMPQQAQGQGAQPGSKTGEQTLKNLLAALQAMKFGQGQSQPGEAGPPQGEGESKQLTLQSFAAANPGGESADSSQLPAGQPGGERDRGTTETPFGKEPAEPRESGAESALPGQLGPGESLSTLLPATGDRSAAQRRYKELYDALAPAAEDAVVQENIPLGSRFLIKRYFQSIRPTE